MNEILAALNWKDAGGVREATPSKDFWTLWREHKSAIKDNGYSVTKRGTEWVVIHSPKNADDVLSKLSRAITTDFEVPLPAGKQFYGYQRAAVEFSKDRNSLISLPMGTGKSAVTVGVMNVKPEYRNILIFCPASIRLNWKKELLLWGTHEYTIGIVDRDYYPEDTDIVIINYDVAKRHRDKINEREWDLLVCDEAHYLKNPDAQRTVAILGKGKRVAGIKSDHKIFLTGTPIINRPIELFPLINALDPKTWNSQWKFAHRYCGATHNGFGWDFSGASNLEELQQKLRSTIMIRHRKEDILPDLPPIRRQVIELPATASLKKLLREEKSSWDKRQELLDDLRSAVELAKVSDNDEEYYGAMRALKEGMAASFTEMSQLRQQIAVEKVPYVLEHLESADEKVVVFFHHKAVGQTLKEALGDAAVMLTGDTKLEERQSAVDRFQEDPTVKYFLGSITAAGVGITLTASSHVVFAELDWRPGMLSQAESRCNRIGSVNTLLVQHLVMEGSLDSRMAQAIIDKQEVIDRALDIEVDDIPLPDLDSIKLPIRKEIEVEAVSVSEEEKVELLAKLRILASLDADHAASQNMMGFNKVDTRIGHQLASQERLSNKQAVLARRICMKYRRQLE